MWIARRVAIVVLVLGWSSQTLGQAPSSADTPSELARTFLEKKQFTEAEKPATEWVAEARRDSQPDELATALHTLGKIQLGLGKFSPAEKSLNEALSLAQKDRQGSRVVVADILDDLVLLHRLQGRRDNAKKLAQRSWEIRSKQARVHGCLISREGAGQVKPSCPRYYRVRGERYTSQPSGPFAIVRIFFGTDRKREDRELTESMKRIDFNDTPNKKLSLGQAVVSVPKDHRVTQIERPWQLTIAGVTIYSEAESAAKHFTIQRIELNSEAQFLADAANILRGSGTYKDQAFIFVHGYNVSFEDALYRVAQVTYDLQFDGVPYLYSWPASRSVVNYLGDGKASSQSRPYLEEFIKLVLERTNATRVHVIAHSMGHEPLLTALNNLAHSGVLARTKKLGQLVLAAPDIDAKAFSRRTSAFTGQSRGSTLYASSKDLAMVASRVWHGGKPRAGDVPPNGPVVVQGIYTIDATYLGTDVLSINHSGYAESRELINDISLLFRHENQPPKERWPVLRMMERAAEKYWEYPPSK
jgi:esterase/lipase superfamily enzyme